MRILAVHVGRVNDTLVKTTALTALLQHSLEVNIILLDSLVRN